MDKPETQLTRLPAFGILFGIFSVLACWGTWSQARFTRKAASFFGFFRFWYAGAPDHKPDLREERHPFWEFFVFGMPGHLITSQIYAKSGILFWSFSFLACRGTWSQARFTRKAASFLGVFLFWHAEAPDHKPDLREKRHPFLDFFVFSMPGLTITSQIYAASGILFWNFSFLTCRGTRS